MAPLCEPWAPSAACTLQCNSSGCTVSHHTYATSRVPLRLAGFWALHHIATAAPPPTLAFHRELLLDTAVRSVTGADERAWPAAAPAACALVIAVEGGGPLLLADFKIDVMPAHCSWTAAGTR